MKATDIISKLKEVIPRYSGLFSDELNVTSLSNSSGTVTCTCDAKHDLKAGNEIFISGALTPITISSLSRSGNIATATTLSNHDLTEGYQQTITLTGADQKEYNGEHNLLTVPNRRTFSFSATGSPVTPATGTIKMVEDIKAGYNGLHTVSAIVDEYTFKFVISSNPESPAQGTIKLRKNFRITGDITIQRFLEAYTKQAVNKAYLVAILGGTNASKDRNTISDATNTSINQNIEIRQRIIDPFSIYVVIPTTNTLTALNARDVMEDIWALINKSILYNVFPSGVTTILNIGAAFTNHNIFAYERAYYIHEFNYEFVYDLTREDGVNVDNSVAFRDIDIRINSQLNAQHNELMHTLDDLDDVPLP